MLKRYYISRLSLLLIMLSSSLALSGCAFRKKPDPLEGINRGVYALNKTVDALYLKPIAMTATKILPDIVLTGIDNFFENLGQLPIIANDIFQFKFKEARIATARFIINSTWGIGGLFDFASKAKLEKHSNDFGQTLAFYGYRESIYIVLPFVGPSTIRDGIGRGVDMSLSVWPYIERERISWTLYGIHVVDIRARNLKKEEVLKEAAVDEYILVRDAYLQHRRYQFGLEPESLDEIEGEWSPLEDGVDSQESDKDRNKDGDEDKTSQSKQSDKKVPETDKEKVSSDQEQTKEDRDLEIKMDMTSEELEAEQVKAHPLKEVQEDSTHIKGSSTLPPEKNIQIK